MLPVEEVCGEKMDVGFYLPVQWFDRDRHCVELYREMIEQAKLAEELGFSSLQVPEHHFIDYLTHPSALLTAVRVAAATRRIPIVTAVLVLPFHDIRVLAGEIAQADCLLEGRLQIGIGRGAFAYEFARFGIPVTESRPRFEESLQVLKALLTREEVAWDGTWYKFPALTVTPRCLQQPHPPIWMSCVTRTAVYHSARQGYDVMTMPLRTEADGVKAQADGFMEGLAAGPGGVRPRLSMLMFVYVAADRPDAEEKLRICYATQQRFHTMFSTPGDVRGGHIVPHPIELSLDELRARTIIGTVDECAEKLAHFARLGVDEVVGNMSFGVAHRDTMAAMGRLARHIMPMLKQRPQAAK
jgi:alkanesulfonate monooxygenase SsuD/methylene tetrahydromethanopterin reductase-like flavin-dependent oxidoreductase (luciferase family)